MSNILDKKRFKTSDDVTVTLFNRCNLNCPFCYLNGLEDRKNDYKINYDILVKRAKEQISTYPYDDIELKLLGGELFGDDVPDESFEQYYNFVKEIYDYTVELNKHLLVYFTTNLVHKNVDRVKKLLNKIDNLIGCEVKLCSSFDFFNRFHTKEQLELFKMNIENYFNRICKINVLADKNLYNMFINNINYDDEKVNYFKYLYDNFFISLGNIVPINNIVGLNNEEKATIYKYFVDNFPKVYPIMKLFYNGGEIRDMHCMPIKNEIKSNGEVTLSCFFQNYYKLKLNIDRDKLEMKAIQKRGCLKCEYYNMCVLPCLYGAYITDIPENEVCYLKQTIEYIRSKSGRSN